MKRLKNLTKIIITVLLFNLLIMFLGGIVTTVGFLSPAMAEHPGGYVEEDPEYEGKIEQEPVLDQGTTIEKMVSLIPQAITHALMALKLRSIPDLIFKPVNFITKDTIDPIWELYKPLFIVGIFIFAMVLAYIGTTLGNTSSPLAKANAYDALWRWALGLIILFMFMPLTSLLFEANNFIVSIAAEHAGNMDTLKVEHTGSFLATALINLYIAGLMLYFNILYVIREVFIIILITVSALVVWTFVIKPAQQSFLMLFSELFSNIFMQASHALAIVIILLLWQAAPDNALLKEWWAQVILVTLIIPIGQFLRNLINVWLNIFGLQEERLAMGATGGIGAALVLPKIISGMAGLKFGASASKGMMPGGGSPPDGGDMGTIGSNPFTMPSISGDNLLGSSNGALFYASGGGTSSEDTPGWKWGNAYNVAGKAAAVAGGVAGITMGLPLGIQTAGMFAGTQIGRRMVSNIGQTHQYMSEGYKNDGATSPSLAKGIGTMVGGASGGYLAFATERGIASKLQGNQHGAAVNQQKTAQPETSWENYIQDIEGNDYTESMERLIQGQDLVQNNVNATRDMETPELLDDQHSWNRGWNDSFTWPEQEESLTGNPNMNTEIFKQLIKKAAKQAIKSLMKWMVGAIGAPTICILFIALVIFLCIYGALPSSSSDEPDSLIAENITLYEDKVASVNPNNGAPKSTHPELERKHFLKWGTILAIDFYRSQIEGKDEIECKVDVLAPELASKFTYEKSTIKTVTRRLVTTMDENGKESTHWETDEDIEDVYLLTKAVTFQGTYEYEYERKTTSHESLTREVTVTKDYLTNTNYKPDWTKFDIVLRREMQVHPVTMEERMLVLEAGIGFTEQKEHLGWLINHYRQPGAILAECPGDLVEVFKKAGELYNIPWYVLMAVAKTESSFQADLIGTENYTGELAEGMMQFLPSTWVKYGIDGDGDGVANPFNPVDAIYSAAYYLNAMGGVEDIEQALYGYNHSWSYVDEVMSLAEQYHEQKVLGAGGYYFFPVDCNDWRKTSSFGVDRGDHLHQGVDIAAPLGTPLRAVVSGTIKVNATDRNPNDNGGIELWIWGDDGNTYYYAHMDCYDVEDGQRVAASQRVGFVGSTGRSTGPHLHFGVIPSQSNDWVDPAYLLGVNIIAWCV